MQALSLTTNRLLLRPPTAADRAVFVDMHTVSKDHLTPWSPSLSAFESLDAFFDRQLARADEGFASGTASRLLAFTRDTQTLVGGFNLNNITRGVAQYADAGWHLDIRAVGKGLATEGVNALLDLAFAPEPHGLGLHRVQCAIIPRNAPSLRVAERCGFQREGIARKYIQINGVWEDHFIFAKLVDEHTLLSSMVQHATQP